MKKIYFLIFTAFCFLTNISALNAQAYNATFLNNDSVVCSNSVFNLYIQHAVGQTYLQSEMKILWFDTFGVYADEQFAVDYKSGTTNDTASFYMAQLYGIKPFLYLESNNPLNFVADTIKFFNPPNTTEPLTVLENSETNVLNIAPSPTVPCTNNYYVGGRGFVKPISSPTNIGDSIIGFDVTVVNKELLYINPTIIVNGTSTIVEGGNEKYLSFGAINPAGCPNFVGGDPHDGCINIKYFLPFSISIPIKNGPSQTLNHTYPIKDSFLIDLFNYNYGDSFSTSIGTFKDIADGVTINNVSFATTETNKPFKANSQLWVSRFFEIVPENEEAAEVTFYFSQNHFTAYNDSANANSLPTINADTSVGITNFILEKSFSPLQANGVLTSIPVTATWNTTKHLWQTTSTFTDYGFFYFHAPPSPNSTNVLLWHGNVMPSGNLLQWKIADANSFEKISLQTSENINNFASIYETTIGSQTDFQFLHNSLVPKNYYRLLLTKTNGDKEYSQILILDRNASQNILLYPNPATTDINVQLYTPINNEVVFIITDITGKQISKKTKAIYQGINQLQFDISSLQIGTYQVQVFVGKFKVASQFLLKK